VLCSFRGVFHAPIVPTPPKTASATSPHPRRPLCRTTPPIWCTGLRRAQRAAAAPRTSVRGTGIRACAHLTFCEVRVGPSPVPAPRPVHARSHWAIPRVTQSLSLSAPRSKRGVPLLVPSSRAARCSLGFRA
jgi:hypothetical protein